MKISTRGRYALRMLICIAENENKPISLKEIHDREGISIKYMEQIILLMHDQDILKSIRGPHGGYVLNKNPEDIKIGDILRITEGNLNIIECIEKNCERKATCKTYKFWEDMNNQMNTYADSYTLKDFISD